MQLEGIRKIFDPVKVYIPEWVLYSLPDALWVYALTLLMLYLWQESSSKAKFIWILAGPVLGVGSESLQFYGLIRGTYDKTDFMMLVTASILPFITYQRRFRRKTNENAKNQKHSLGSLFSFFSNSSSWFSK